MSSSTSHIRKTELCTRYGLQERDFRKLDPSVSTAVPTILVRRAAILVSLELGRPRARLPPSRRLGPLN